MHLLSSPLPQSSSIDANSATRGEWETLYPFADRRCELPGGPVHYVDEGTGPVLLFLPPAPLGAFMYRPFVRALRNEYRCVALDFPGFGRSPPWSGASIDLWMLSTVTREFVRALDLRQITLVAHDSGGLIGMHAAARQPDRYAGLVLADTVCFPLGRFSFIRGMLRLVSSRPAAALQRRFNILVRLITAVGVRRRKFSRAERAAYAHAFPDPASRQRPLEIFRAMATDDSFFAETATGMVQLRRLPVLSVYGQFDPVRLLGVQRKLASVFPQHEGVVIKGEGHFPTEGAADEMISAIRRWRLDNFRPADGVAGHG